jgi:polyvinyl alcohol dehydrogenase (cytochrome)
MTMHTLLLLSLTASIEASTPLPPNCDAQRQQVTATREAEWASWGADVRNTRFQDSAAAGITARDVPRLKLKWVFSLGGVANARSQPAVAAGRVFVGTEAGSVFALDAETGCTWWSAKADLPVRSAIVYSTLSGGRSAVFFGDVGANVYALDAATGARLWKTDVDDHAAAVVTGAAQVFDGVLYVPVSSYESFLPIQPKYECCTFRGSVVALEAATGKVLWKTYTIDVAAQPTTTSKSGAQMHGPSGAAVWSALTMDERRDRLYFGTGNNYSDPVTSRSDAVVALDRRSGAIVWARQFAARDAYNSSCEVPGKPNCPTADGPDADFGQPPLLVTLPNGRRALVIGQKSGDVHALDPDRDGALLWSVNVGPGGKLGGVHWGSATDGRNMYVALGGQEMRVFADTTIKEGFRMEPDATKGGGLFALNLVDGKMVWKAAPVPCDRRPRCSPAQSAPVTVIQGAVFSGSLDGHVRAYSTETGATVWDFDTVRDYESTNGMRARGGSLDVAGPVVAGGMLYVMSGYALFAAMPGNVLLAFSVDGK